MRFGRRLVDFVPEFFLGPGRIAPRVVFGSEDSQSAIRGDPEPVDECRRRGVGLRVPAAAGDCRRVRRQLVLPFSDN